MVRELCGEDRTGFLLVTSKWNHIKFEVGEAREKELWNFRDYRPWQRKIGSLRGQFPTLRYGGEREEAEVILDYIIRNAKPEAFAIQTEMASNRVPLMATRAGRRIADSFQMYKTRHARDIESLEEEEELARNEQDLARLAEIQHEIDSYRHKFDRTEMQLARLQTTSEDLIKEFDLRRSKDWEALLQKLRRTEVRLAEKHQPETADDDISTSMDQLDLDKLDDEIDEINRSECEPM